MNGNSVPISTPETPASATPQPTETASTRVVGMPTSSAASRLLATARSAPAEPGVVQKGQSSAAITAASTAAGICGPGKV